MWRASKGSLFLRSFNACAISRLSVARYDSSSARLEGSFRGGGRVDCVFRISEKIVSPSCE